MDLLCTEVDAGAQGIADPVFLDDERVLNNLKVHEQRHLLSPCYFNSVQTDLEPYMRKVVATWLLEVCEEEKCDEEVFPLAMNILDRFLSRVHIQKTQLQLLSTACLLISSKFLQCRLLSAQRLVMFTDYSITLEELQAWELLVLSQLQWDVHAVTAYDFLNLWLRRIHCFSAGKHKLIKKHAHIFVTLCTAEVRFSYVAPSLIACACLALSLHGLNIRQDMSDVLKLIHQISGLDATQIECVMGDLEEIINQNRKETPTSDLRRPLREENDVRPFKKRRNSINSSACAVTTHTSSVSLTPSTITCCSSYTDEEKGSPIHSPPSSPLSSLAVLPSLHAVEETFPLSPSTSPLAPLRCSSPIFCEESTNESNENIYSVISQTSSSSVLTHRSHPLGDNHLYERDCDLPELTF